MEKSVDKLLGWWISESDHLEKLFELVDKLLGWWIRNKIGLDFVTSVHNTGVITTTKEMANLVEGQFELGKKKISGKVTGIN